MGLGYLCSYIRNDLSSIDYSQRRNPLCLLACGNVHWNGRLLTSVKDALTLLKLGWHGSSSRNGDKCGDECNELHFVK
jgi:hypothetical protein